MCEETCSESGQLLTIKPCGWYLVIKSDRDRLAGVVAGMEDQNARITLQYDQLDDIFRQRGFDLSQSMARALELEKENARLLEALKFYANKYNYSHCYVPGGDNIINVDGGEMAGKALKEVGSERE